MVWSESEVLTIRSTTCVVLKDFFCTTDQITHPMIDKSSSMINVRLKH